MPYTYIQFNYRRKLYSQTINSMLTDVYSYFFHLTWIIKDNTLSNANVLFSQWAQPFLNNINKLKILFTRYKYYNNKSTLSK